MRAFLMSPQIDEQIQLLIQHAEKNRYTQQMIREVMAGKRAPAGDDPLNVLDIPQGYRICFSFEQHSMGWYRHISVSVQSTDRKATPNPLVVEQLLQKFGMPPIKNCDNIYVEPYQEADPLHDKGATNAAVNVIARDLNEKGSTNALSTTTG